MNEILIAGLLASARDFHAAGAALTKAAESFQVLAAALVEADEAEAEPGDDGLYKKANGRMTPAGAKAIEAAFASGATITEVSKRFQIHTSAANYRHKEWLKTQQQKSA